jgi:hypothetical protein
VSDLPEATRPIANHDRDFYSWAMQSAAAILEH